MTKSLKPATHAPTSDKDAIRSSSSRPPTSIDPRKQFMLAALQMSWQLAIVVLVPILGGFWLDERLHSAPLWTGLGFGVAMILMALVVWRQLQLFSPGTTLKGGRK